MAISTNSGKGSKVAPFIPGSAAAGVDMYVPDWISSMFPGTYSSDPETRNSAYRKATIATNTAGAVLLAAGLVAGVRGISGILHRAKALGLNQDNPAKGRMSDLDTMYKFEPGIAADFGKKASSTWTLDAPNSFTPSGAAYYILAAGLPMLGAIGAGALMNSRISKLVGDSTIDRVRRKRDRREGLRDDLIFARAANARGKLDRKQLKELNDRVKAEGMDTVAEAGMMLDSMPKSAGVNSKVGLAYSVLGLSAATVLAASALGSYAYTESRDPKNVKFRAIKKGLKEYAKTKSGMAPIVIGGAAGGSPFDVLDADAETPVPPREAPEVPADAPSSKTISVTL